VQHNSRYWNGSETSMSTPLNNTYTAAEVLNNINFWDVPQFNLTVTDVSEERSASI
jgi:hypothetical protein